MRPRKRYRWAPALTIANAFGSLLAIVGAASGNWLMFLFPQVWGWALPFGATLGMLTIAAVVISALAMAGRAIDGRDWLNRAWAGATMAAFVSFIVCALPGIPLLINVADSMTA